MSDTNRDTLYELYALGLLEEPELSEIEAELRSGSPDAQRLLRQALANNAMLATLAPAADPPPRLRRRILAAAGVEEKTGWTWIGAWGLATAALLGGLVYFSTEATRLRKDGFSVREELAVTQTELRRSHATLAFLRDPGTTILKSGSSEERQPVARVFVNPGQGVLLIANNLPRLEPGKVFEMWLVPKSGGPIPAGTFSADASGAALHRSTGSFDPNATAAVALSVEPDGGSPAPTTTPFLITGM
jgi:anti-sigma-K factor RskA